MRSFTLACLLAISSLTGADALAGGCRPRVLSTDEKASLAEFVRRNLGLAADMNSLSACGYGVELWSVREPQADGAEHWSYLACSAMSKKWHERWSCVEHRSRGIRVDTYAGELGVWVSLPDGMSPQTARGILAAMFVRLAGDSLVPACTPDEGGPKTSASLRSHLTAGEGRLYLGWFEGGAVLGGGLVELSFERGDDSAVLSYLKCWSEMEVVVTS